MQGAPETVLELSEREATAEGEVPLDAAGKARWAAENEALAGAEVFSLLRYD